MIWRENVSFSSNVYLFASHLTNLLYFPVLSEEPEIVGYDAAKYVFTDITYGVHDRDRIIVVREPSGTLRHAVPNERDRLNQIYFPMKGREIKSPPLFDLDQMTEVNYLFQVKYIQVMEKILNFYILLTDFESQYLYLHFGQKLCSIWARSSQLHKNSSIRLRLHRCSWGLRCTSFY